MVIKYGARFNGFWNRVIGDVPYERPGMAADFLTVSEARLKSVYFFTLFWEQGC